MIMEVPEETDLLAFFEGDAVEARPSDGYWCYEVCDDDAIELRFSFNTFERSVQTVVQRKGSILCSVSHENATAIRLEGGEKGQRLTVDFQGEGSVGRLSLCWKDGVRCDWWDLAR